MTAEASPATTSVPARRGVPDLPHFVKDPNPIWMRELRQAARLGRTPWIVLALVLSLSLLLCAIGALAASNQTAPAEVGIVLHQTFFSIAYFVVAIIGPGIAANGIASEREGRTWEAILLTGMLPASIIRGKFFAAYSTLALYIVVLAPVGALPFIFGGVTAGEVLWGFVFLFAFAAVAVAFGLALSSLMASLRGALVATLVLAVFVSPLLFVFFGFGGSVVANQIWTDVPKAYPIWLPTALVRAKFGVDFAVVLILAPALLLLLPGWFLYSLTNSNLAGASDDQSTGLRRWMIATTVLLALVGALTPLLGGGGEPSSFITLFAQFFFFAHVAFCGFLIAFEPPGPSRRVRVQWEREKFGRLRRALGPGLARAAIPLAVLAAAGTAAIVVGGEVALVRSPWTHAAEAREMFVMFGEYALFFDLFLVGAVTFARGRGSAPWTVRLIVAAVLILMSAAPWVAAAIAWSASRDESSLAVACVSPFYVFLEAAVLDKTSSSSATLVAWGIGAAFMWGILGVALLSSGLSRARRSVVALERGYAETDAALRKEDEAALAASRTPPADPAPPAPDPA